MIVPEFPNFDLDRYFAEHDIACLSHEGDHVEISFNCPECHRRGEPSPDTKKKCWLNPEKGTFVCYRCSFTGGIIRLVQAISQTNYLKAIKIVRGRDLDPMEHCSLKLFDPELKIKMHDEDDTLRELELPYGYQPIDKPHSYLKDRGIPWEYAMRHDWGISEAGYTKGRIIVPTFMEGRLVFWQARLCREPNEDEQKVLNPTGVSARSVLYNFDVAKEYEKIVIVEGFIDAVKVGPNAVASNGKRLHPQQVLWLEKTKAKEIIVCYDRDAWTDAKVKRSGDRIPSSVEHAVGLLSLSFDVKVVKMPDDRDPGSYKYRSKLLQEIISTAKPLKS